MRCASFATLAVVVSLSLTLAGCCCGELPPPSSEKKTSKKSKKRSKKSTKKKKKSAKRVPVKDTFLGDPYGYLGIAVTPDGSLVATHAGEEDVTLWEGATGAHKRSVSLKGDVVEVAFSEDGERLVALSTRKGKIHVNIIDTEKGKVRHSYPTASGTLDALFMLDRGRYVFIERHDDPYTLMRVRDGEELSTIHMHGARATRGDVCSADARGKSLACVWGDDDLDDPEFLAQTTVISVADYKPSTSLKLTVKDIADSPRGLALGPDVLAVTTSREEGDTVTSKITIYDTRTGERVKVLAVPNSGEDSDYVYNTRYSPDGHFLLAFNADDMHIWDTTQWKRTTVSGVDGVTVYSGWLPGRKNLARLLLMTSKLEIWELQSRKGKKPKAKRLKAF